MKATRIKGPDKEKGTHISGDSLALLVTGLAHALPLRLKVGCLPGDIASRGSQLAQGTRLPGHIRCVPPRRGAPAWHVPRLPLTSLSPGAPFGSVPLYLYLFNVGFQST